MTNGYFWMASVTVGVLAFILFVLSVSVAQGWLPMADLDNQTSANVAVYGVVASIAAIGLYKLAGAD